MLTLCAAWCRYTPRGSHTLVPSRVSICTPTRSISRKGITFPAEGHSGYQISKELRFPVENFQDFRRYGNNIDGNRAFSYFVTGTASMGYAAALKNGLSASMESMLPSADIIAAQLVVDLKEIPEGSVKVFNYKGKPVYVKHRTPEEIAEATAVPMNELRDPRPDSERVQRPEWLILIGLCTHLGCMPLHNRGDYSGGFYCPCHGAHFDSSGRTRKGPAPTNMETVDHYFLPDDKVVIGFKYAPYLEGYSVQ